MVVIDHLGAPFGKLNPTNLGAYLEVDPKDHRDVGFYGYRLAIEQVRPILPGLHSINCRWRQNFWAAENLHTFNRSLFRNRGL